MEGPLAAVLDPGARDLMAQVLKEEVRQRILAAALEEFAAKGVPGATMAAIADRAGITAGAIYRYYPGKAELFDAVVPPSLAAAFAALLDRRVRALAPVALGSSDGDDLGGELLDFWIAHRLAVVVLLDRAGGTAYADYGARFVDRLVGLSIDALRAVAPDFAPTDLERFVLTRIFEGTRRALADILAAHADERAIREGIAAFWSYQIPGLRGFSERALARHRG